MTGCKMRLIQLWRFTGELTTPDDVDKAVIKEGVAPDFGQIKKTYEDYVSAALREATLMAPEDAGMRKGGKTGLHTEDHGYLLAEMQSLPRAFPGAAW